MIWRNPWAWLGLLTIAVPIVIHLLSRRTARVQQFPTLRFLPQSRSTVATRLRLHERLLLCVRILVLAAATAALAQPYFLTERRQGQRAAAAARIVVVDTSLSMRRATAAGVPAVDVARDSARAYTQDAGFIVETVSPAHAVAGAAAWLATQTGPRELVIFSDFQAGTITRHDLQALPPGTGVQLRKVGIAGASDAFLVTKASGTSETIAEVAHGADASVATWRTRAFAAPKAPALHVRAADAEQSLADAMLDAAVSAGAPFHGDTTRNVTILFADVDAEPSDPADRPWMSVVIARLADPALLAARRDTADGREHLLLYTDVQPGTIAAARFVSSVLHALDASPPPAELEPGFIPADTLADWSRAAEPVHGSADDASDGRWFWLAVIALLAVETWLRRRRVHAQTA